LPPDHKAHAQTIQALKKRGPGIRAVADRYNALVTSMVELKRMDARFKDAILPHSVDLDHLFDLDIDDELLQDVGLEFDDDTEPPDWLADDSVRFGIKAMQLHDRAVEERARLVNEVGMLVNWLVNEIQMVSRCIDKCEGARLLLLNPWALGVLIVRFVDLDAVLLFQLHRRQSYLCLLGQRWRISLRDVDAEVMWPLEIQTHMGDSRSHLVEGYEVDVGSLIGDSGGQEDQDLEPEEMEVDDFVVDALLRTVHDDSW
jgi:hypothetical protein